MLTKTKMTTHFSTKLKRRMAKRKRSHSSKLTPFTQARHTVIRYTWIYTPKRYTKMNATASTVAEICRKPAAGTLPLHSGNRQKAIGFKRDASALSNRTK